MTRNPGRSPGAAESPEDVLVGGEACADRGEHALVARPRQAGPAGEGQHRLAQGHAHLEREPVDPTPGLRPVEQPGSPGFAELARYIDWTPFFQTWELKGRYPKILDDEKQGPAARQLFEDAQAMLRKIIEEKWFAPKAVIGFWPANAFGDDIRLFTEDTRSVELDTFFTLRQQLTKRDGKPNVALAISSRRWTAARRITSAGLS